MVTTGSQGTFDPLLVTLQRTVDQARWIGSKCGQTAMSALQEGKRSRVCIASRSKL